MPDTLASFRGPVSCRRRRAEGELGALARVLGGLAAEREAERRGPAPAAHGAAKARECVRHRSRVEYRLAAHVRGDGVRDITLFMRSGVELQDLRARGQPLAREGDARS